MAESICNLLNLDLAAGLGRRLAQIKIMQDSQNPNLFYIFSTDDVVEAAALAHALSVRANKVLHVPVSFTSIRTIACH